MTDEEAREQARAFTDHRGFAAIEGFVDLMVAENARQNLVSTATLPMVWSRHILDSLQLIRFARGNDRHWVDIGSGGGLPGVVLACLGRWRITMIEPRRRRADFLTTCIDTLGLGDAAVIQANAQTVSLDRADLVTARAVGSIGDLLAMARGFADPSTRFVLPRGAGAAADVANAAGAWHGLFHVEHSVTQAGAGIVIADEVRPR